MKATHTNAERTASPTVLVSFRSLARLLATAVFFLVVSGCASGPRSTRLVPRVPAPPAPAAPAPEVHSAEEAEAIVAAAELDTALPLDPALTFGELDNGLTYVIRPNSEPEGRVDLWLALDVGSVLEDEDQRGLAHFVEHMAFNGTERFQQDELVQYLESIGMRFGPDLNAYTGFDETVYMLRMPTDSADNVTTALDIMVDWLTAISFEEEEVRKERGVVLEEWRLGRGADARILDLQYPSLFSGSRYAERLVIGTEESILEAPTEALVRFYEDWYRPDLASVVAVGDVDPAWMERQIREAFAGIPAAEEPRERPVYRMPSHEETLVSIATDPEVTQTTVGIYTKHEPPAVDTYGDYRRTLVSALYDRMLNDRLTELTQKPGSPFIVGVATTDNVVRTAEFYLQVAVVEPSRALEGLAALVREAERVDQHGFTEGELERAKKDVLRGFEQGFQERGNTNSRRYADEYRRHFLEGEATPGIAVERSIARRWIPTITLDEVNRAAREWISEENRVILLSGPSSAEEQLPSEEDLLAVFEQVEGEEIAAYVDTFQDEPLVPEPPAGSEVVEETRIPEIGVTEWRLANGVRVVLKPTDFKQDEVLLYGFSPGGLSLVAEDDFRSASLATTLLGESGVGSFSAADLTKALAGKRVQVAPFLDELTEGVRGGASPEDLKTLFELIYLHLTAPRLDDDAAAAFLERLGAFIANRTADPEVVYTDRLVSTIVQDHPRGRPWSEETLAEVDPELALALYRERFADASDFTFILAGSFDPAEVRPLVERYLGGLPGDREEGDGEGFLDLGIRSPEGVETFEVVRGLEPKARVDLLYTTEDLPWSRELAFRTRMVAEALGMSLRRVLREDLGGTYGVAVNGDLTPRPFVEASVAVRFGCDPEKLDELIEATFADVEELKEEGPTWDTVQKIRAAETRERETRLRENRFWIDVLNNYYETGRDPRDIVRYDELVESLTPEMIRETARLVLQEDRYVLGVLKPEAPSSEEASLPNPPEGSGTGSETQTGDPSGSPDGGEEER